MPNNNAIIKFPIEDKKRENIGQRIDISGLDKEELFVALYCNIRKRAEENEIERLMVTIQFLENNYCFNRHSVNIDLSKDSFDPSHYDQTNRTFHRFDVKTAYQCVDAVKQATNKRYQENRTEALRLLKLVLNEETCCFTCDDCCIGFSPSTSQSKISSFHRVLTDNDIHTHLICQDQRLFSNGRLLLLEPMDTLVEKLRKHLIHEAMNESILPRSKVS